MDARYSGFSKLCGKSAKRLKERVPQTYETAQPPLFPLLRALSSYFAVF
jgi:hypothetical protein